MFVLQYNLGYSDVILKEIDSVIPYYMTKEFFGIPTTLLFQVKKFHSESIPNIFKTNNLCLICHQFKINLYLFQCKVPFLYYPKLATTSVSFWQEEKHKYVKTLWSILLFSEKKTGAC